MANDSNLRTPTSEEAREIGRKGGIASGKSRRERKQFQETLEILLNMPLDKSKVAELEKISTFKNLKGKNITVQDAILIAQVQKALKGDRGSAEFVRDTLGENPKLMNEKQRNTPGDEVKVVIDV